MEKQESEKRLKNASLAVNAEFSKIEANPELNKSEIWLANDICRLEPLTMAHHDELVESIKDGELWKLWYTLIPEPEKMQDDIQRRLIQKQAGEMIPFVIIDMKNKRLVGATTYLNIDMLNKRLEIGATWLGKSSQGTAMNKSVKLLLLTYAFEEMGCHAVEFRTHFHNRNSRQSIESIGAKLDGILRNHMIMPDNTLRDTCVYSIIDSEWPTVKKLITEKLKRNI